MECADQHVWSMGRSSILWTVPPTSTACYYCVTVAGGRCSHSPPVTIPGVSGASLDVVLLWPDVPLPAPPPVKAPGPGGAGASVSHCCLIQGTGYQLPGARGQVPGAKCQAPGSRQVQYVSTKVPRVGSLICAVSDLSYLQLIPPRLLVLMVTL